MTKRVHLLAGVLAVLVASFASADIPPIMPPPVTNQNVSLNSLTIPGTVLTSTAAVFSPAVQTSTITLPAWTSYAPVWTGFSADPTAAAAYTRIGKTCVVRINASADGTSNTTGLAFTLPFPSKAAVSYAATGRGIDNGALNLGVIYLGAASSTANAYLGVSAGNWTNSGAKSWSGTITYETE